MSEVTAALSRINSIVSYLPLAVAAIVLVVVTVINFRARARASRDL